MPCNFCNNAYELFKGNLDFLNKNLCEWWCTKCSLHFHSDTWKHHVEPSDRMNCHHEYVNHFITAACPNCDTENKSYIDECHYEAMVTLTAPTPTQPPTQPPSQPPSQPVSLRASP